MLQDYKVINDRTERNHQRHHFPWRIQYPQYWGTVEIDKGGNRPQNSVKYRNAEQNYKISLT